MITKSAPLLLHFPCRNINDFRFGAAGMITRIILSLQQNIIISVKAIKSKIIYLFSTNSHSKDFTQFILPPVTRRTDSIKPYVINLSVHTKTIKHYYFVLYLNVFVVAIGYSLLTLWLLVTKYFLSSLLSTIS
jgi:hypothetical protein